MKDEADQEAAEREVVGDDTRFRRNRLNHDPTQLDSQKADNQLEAAISYALPSSPEVACEAARFKTLSALWTVVRISQSRDLAPSVVLLCFLFNERGVRRRRLQLFLVVGEFEFELDASVLFLTFSPHFLCPLCSCILR